MRRLHATAAPECPPLPLPRLRLRPQSVLAQLRAMVRRDQLPPLLLMLLVGLLRHVTGGDFLSLWLGPLLSKFAWGGDLEFGFVQVVCLGYNLGEAALAGCGARGGGACMRPAAARAPACNSAVRGAPLSCICMAAACLQPRWPRR